MAKKLVIVESPAKAKTIEKFLGTGFEVRASMGHILDLPKKGMGVALPKKGKKTPGEHDFEPKYEVIERKEKLISELKSAAKKAETIYLAPDPDREGEFIAWSLKSALGLKNPQRAVFNEITKRAVQDAIAHPRLIDENLFNAQQARRVLDRLVGYKISPLLWRRVQSGTSAGRVQSVAVRLICEREAEIRAFVPEEYWTIVAHLSKQKQRKTFEAQLFARLADENAEQQAAQAAGKNGAGKNGAGKNGKAGNGDEPERTKIKIGSEAEAKAILAELEGATYRVRGVEQKDVRRQPWLPYTTSTMQQDASVRLRFPPKKTMSLAQHLYEGMELGERGHQGLITYMRTDSTRISADAQQAVKQFVKERFGENYVGEGRSGKAKATVQDAHEAIRPTDVTLTPEAVKPYLSADLFKLYQLIWRRFVAAFMAPAVFDTVRVDITAAQYLFRANGSSLKFPGFYAVWPREEDEETLPELEIGELLDLHQLTPDQHFTQPPPRYSEASLIKELEERGIGRPSTYVPIVSTIQERNYVEQQERRFVPTWLGETVNEVMTKHFPDIVDVGFTVDMEQKLDAIEEGEQSWTAFLNRFYDAFRETLTRAESEMPRVQKPVEEIDELCPDCGRPLVVRSGRFGPFISCSGFPECAFKKKLVNKTGALCPQCGGDLVVRKTKKRGKVFYGCANYPTCNFATWDRPVAGPCPNCGGLVTVAQGKNVAACTACGTVIEGAEQIAGADGASAGAASAASLPARAARNGHAGPSAARTGARSGAAASRSGTKTRAASTGRSAKTTTSTRKTSAAKSTAVKRTAAKKGTTTGTTTGRGRTTKNKETVVVS
ncbi:MAG TPA: type I DNA topoisomerase [Ktedonobacterales bacterium]|nr:type I DNA topoisomerase [Ktedonobacterales bacterium]